MIGSAGWATVLQVVQDSDGSRDRAAVLDEAVTLGADIAPGVLGCSLTVDGQDGRTTPHSSRPLAMTLDQAQYTAGTGPCIEAATTGAAQQLDSIAADLRFPRFAAAASANGVLSSFSLPLPSAPWRAALNLYAADEQAFDTRRAREVAGLLARLIAALLGAPDPGTTSATRSAVDLATRRGAAVREAVQVVARQVDVTLDEAYLQLAERSRVDGRSMAEVAEQVRDGERPDGASR